MNNLNCLKVELNKHAQQPEHLQHVVMLANFNPELHTQRIDLLLNEAKRIANEKHNDSVILIYLAYFCSLCAKK